MLQLVHAIIDAAPLQAAYSTIFSSGKVMTR